MKKQSIFQLLVTGCLILALSLALVPSVASQSPGPALKFVTIEAQSGAEVKELAKMGLDIAAIREGPVVEGPRGIPMQTYHVEAVISSIDAEKLSQSGFSWSDVPGQGPAKKIGEPYQVYHSFDEPVYGIKDQLRTIAATYPKITQVKTFGHSIQNRPMMAMKLTNEKLGKKDGKPQVLIVATHHAREWVATEMSMRLIKYLTTNYGSDARVTDLLDNVEIWIVPVGNPDGYQYTFTNERLWRKNLRDNNGDGQITIADGVDINRNFPNHWGLDDEGSSPVWSSETYRGTAPNSEPETQALMDLIRENDFKFALSYHTYGNLILYPWGWQVSTPSLDDPIFVAQSGTDSNPAIFDSLLDQGYNPGVSADLYTTNGEFTDWAYGELGIPAYTVELTDFFGFTFPDDEDMVQTVFEDNLEFALSMAESAIDPANPVSPVGLPAQDAYHNPVTTSTGPNQMIEVLARKGLPLTLSYNINGGAAQTAGFNEEFGEFYNQEAGTYYSRYVAYIRGQQAGDSVEYEISAGSSLTPGSYSYTVENTSGNPILIVAAEDYSGTNPIYFDPTQPNFLTYYTDALDAGGYNYDVWDVDAQGIPTNAEVLSHYEVVLWYTGDDYVARIPLNLDTQETEVLNFRDFLNYNSGKLFASGQDLAWLAATAGYYSDDFFQYYLGANIELDTGGIDGSTGLPFNVAGTTGDPVFDGLSFGLQDGDGADNQYASSTFLVTSAFLPHFDSTLAARYVRPGGPYDPHSGSYYEYSQIADLSFKRLGGTFTIPDGSPTLKFWTSYDTEANWDYAFVEINEVGTDTWTTLPDMNGGTTTSTGLSCFSGWVNEIHPFLAHYMDSTCNPIGSTGSWNAFTGNSGGWQQVEMDLSAYAGKTVELHISYASDWATQGLGVFVDDIELSGYPLEDFEAGTGDWSASVPAGSTAFNNWERITGAGFPEGPAIRTPYSVYLGFGFEGISSASDRNALMDQVMNYLGQ